MKFKSPITVYCSAFAVIGLIICGWLLISEGVVFTLALTLAFFCLGSLITSFLVISDTVWGNQMRWASNAYRSGSASEQDIDRDLKTGRRILICVSVISGILAIPVFIQTGDIIQI